MPRSPLPPELAAIALELERLMAEVRTLAETASGELLMRRPAGRGWSAAECIAHLSESNRQYVLAIRKALAEAPDSRDGSRYRHTFLGGWMARSLEPPVRCKLRSPKAFLPPAIQHSREELVSDFEAVQSEILELVERSAAKDPSRVRLSSPAFRLLRLNLWDALTILAAHERRHLLQAREALTLAAAAAEGESPAPGGRSQG